MTALTDEIIALIAQRYPFPAAEISEAYRALRSIDATIAACETAVSIGAAGPGDVVKMAAGEYSLQPTATKENRR